MPLGPTPGQASVRRSAKSLADCRGQMLFAGQILAMALVKDRPQDQDHGQFLCRTFELMVKAQYHALDVAYILADKFFLRR